MELVSDLLMGFPTSTSPGPVPDEAHDHAWRKASSGSGVAAQEVYRCDLCPTVWPPEAT
jgi:hypothetical protein